MVIDLNELLSNQQNLTTTPGTAASTNVLDMRNATPALVTTNPNATNLNFLYPAPPQSPMQFQDGEKFIGYLISGATAAGTGVGTLTVNVQFSTDNSTFDTVSTLVLGLFNGATTQNFRAGEYIPIMFEGPRLNSARVAYNYVRFQYVTAATTITTATIISAFLQAA